MPFFAAQQEMNLEQRDKFQQTLHFSQRNEEIDAPKHHSRTSKRSLRKKSHTKFRTIKRLIRSSRWLQHWWESHEVTWCRILMHSSSTLGGVHIGVIVADTCWVKAYAANWFALGAFVLMTWPGARRASNREILLMTIISSLAAEPWQTPIVLQSTFHATSSW
jgi:hypothetical protein